MAVAPAPAPRARALAATARVRVCVGMALAHGSAAALAHPVRTLRECCDLALRRVAGPLRLLRRAPQPPRDGCGRARAPGRARQGLSSIFTAPSCFFWNVS